MDVTPVEVEKSVPLVPSKSEWLRADFSLLSIDPIAVDRENAVLRGMVVAQEGVFKNEWRGEFDKDGLSTIVDLINARPNGVKSRFTHPTMSDDGLGKYLGQVMNARLDETKNGNGKKVDCVRADLHFDRTALDTPPGGGKPYGQYVMDLTESNPDAISSSVVIKKEEAYRLNEDGTRKKDKEGVELAPLWKPLEIHASDIVDEGDAVDGLLSADTDRFPYWKGTALLNKTFPGAPREVFHEKLHSFLNRYENLRFGDKKNLDAGEPMECPECGKKYKDDDKYCSECGAKLQKSKPHGDENMSDKQPVKPVVPEKGKEPEKLTAEQAELARLREENAKQKTEMEALAAKANEAESLASVVEGLQQDVATLNADKDRMEVEKLFDGELFHKWATDEHGALVDQALKTKTLSKELYDGFITSIRNRKDVKPRLSQVAAHIHDDGKGAATNDQLIEKYKVELSKTMPDAKPNVLLRKATSAAMKDSEWREEGVSNAR